MPHVIRCRNLFFLTRENRCNNLESVKMGHLWFVFSEKSSNVHMQTKAEIIPSASAIIHLTLTSTIIVQHGKVNFGVSDYECRALLEYQPLIKLTLFFSSHAALNLIRAPQYTFVFFFPLKLFE